MTLSDLFANEALRLHEFPVAGQKVFIRSKQMLDGYEDLPHQWSGIVPAAS